MTKKEFMALQRELASKLSQPFRIKGAMMILPPVSEFLRGIAFEGSSFNKKTFFVNFFIMPLLAPMNYVAYVFGDRLQHDNAGIWSIDDCSLLEVLCEAIERDAIPFFNRIESIADWPRLASMHPNPIDPYVLQSTAYAALLSNSIDGAQEALELLLRTINVQSDWEREMRDRAELILKTLRKSPTSAKDQINKWKMQTIENLGLKELI